MPQSQRIHEFDAWRPLYGGAQVRVLVAGTSTLASCYSDPALTVAVANPITLITTKDSLGIQYGKFLSPVYVGVPYQLVINDADTTGIQRLPIYDLVGMDASKAKVRSLRGSILTDLDAWLDSPIRTTAFGTLGTVSATNTTILSSAIAAAASQGGGIVQLPPGNFPFTTLTLPQGVVLRGEGRLATTIRSVEAQSVITLGGDYAGLEDLTLDGVNLVAGSNGLAAVGVDWVGLRRVTIKRFDRGIFLKGGVQHKYEDLHVSGCNTGAELRGDKDAAGTKQGGPYLDLAWESGVVELNVNFGLILSYEDDSVNGCVIKGVQFTSNIGPGLKINGARQTRLLGCRWTGNTVSIDVADDSDTSKAAFNTVKGLHITDGTMTGGMAKFDGTCEDVQFEAMDFSDVDFNLTIPDRPITLVDCTEDSQVTVAGATEKLGRLSHVDKADFPGVTTDATVTTAWARELEPGEIIRARLRAMANQRNGQDFAALEAIVTASRPGATISYDTAPLAPVVGTIVSGNVSGASARIIAVSHAGTTGSLTLRSITGTFQVGETCQTTDAKTLRVTVGLSSPAAVVNATDAIGTQHKSAGATAWALTADATGSLVRARVTGEAAKTIEWLVQVDLVRN